MKKSFLFFFKSRSSASVPTSYSSRLAELHETTSRLTNKERSEANDNLLGYRRSTKTDSDVAATLEKYGLKSDPYKLRNDSMPNRFLNTTNLDSRYSSNRKLCGTSTLELSRLCASSSKPPKSALNSRLQRKDSLTKSEATDTSLSPIPSIERKISSSAIGGSSSPIEIRKPEVWDKKLSVSNGETHSRAVFDSDSFNKVLVDDKDQSRSGAREIASDEDTPNFFECDENEEKTLTFEEIRKKFDSNDVIALRGGLENSYKSSQDESRASISNGVILGVHNFGQMQYLDRNSKSKKIDSFAEGAEPETGEPGKIMPESNNSFSSPQTLRRTVLKPIPSAVKNSNSNSVLRKSPDSIGEVGNSFKKKSSPDLKKSSSPEKKEGGFSNFAKLLELPVIETAETTGGEKKLNEGALASLVEAKREARNATINSKLGLESKNDLKIQSKGKNEKLLAKVEQTLLKQPEVDGELLNSLSRLRRSPETKPKDFENQTKVIELRRVDMIGSSPFESENKKSKEEKEKPREEVKEKPREKKSESPNRKLVEKVTVQKSKEVTKPKEVDSDFSPQKTMKDTSPTLKTKESSSPKEEKDSQNLKERELNKKSLTEELTKDIKCMRKEERENMGVTKEMPTWDKQDLSTNISNRTFPGQASTSHSSNSQSFNKKVVSILFLVGLVLF